MCGITGIVRREGPVDREALRAITDRLRHRGPDASGVFVSDNVGLGHRRLSIIDTSEAANQPMFNEDGTVALVVNGEIYNFQQLRETLRAAGHVFKTDSDSEVLLHAWEEYSVRCVEHLRGMFAFAIHDSRRGQLFLVRDRLGKKPLFYSVDGERLLFASEIKAILAAGGASEELDLDALADYATLGYSVGERTIYRDIRKLLPGHHLLLDTSRSALEPRIERYWDLAYDTEEVPSEDEWLERLDACLSESVRLRMISDVPLGAFLSGGIDSSLVAAYMARHSDSPILAVSMAFREKSYDESPYAAAVAKHLGAEHHVETVTPDAVGDLPLLVEAYDEPFADPSAIPTYHLCRVTRRRVTVALSGDGGDEHFLGYPRYRKMLAAERTGRLLTPAGKALAAATARRLGPGRSGKRSIERLGLGGFDRWNHTLGHSEDHLSMLRDDVRAGLSPIEGRKMARDYGRHAGRSMLEQCQYNDIMNYLPEDILAKVDRASMAHALEVRCPLLDQDFVELAAKIPARFKLRDKTGKVLLRRLVERYIPREMLDRPKTGFSVPLRRWFKQELRPDTERMLADESNTMWRYFDRETAVERMQRHVKGQAHAQTELWRLLFFSKWAETHLRA